MPGFSISLTGPIIAAAIIAVVVIIIIICSYVKAPPDKAYIISGLRKNPKILIGRAGLKMPFFERKDELLIKQISIDIKTDGYVPTADFIGVNIDAVAKVRVMSEGEGVKLAMKNFLNMKEQQIADSLVDSLQGNMREIIGTITLKDLCNDRKKFGDEVQQKAQEDMKRLGIEIISCNVQHVTDEKDLINALGQDNMAKIQKDASIAKAQADRDVAIAQAQKEANDAKVLADTEIAVKQNELAIKRAELKTVEDSKQAEADAAYEIQKENQRKTIEVTKTNADIARQEKEVDLKRKEAEVKEQALDAEVKKKAEAEKFAKQQAADAALYERQRKAEAEKFELEKQQEVKKIQAEADLFAKQKEADARKAQAEAELFARQQEANAIAAKGKAEADAIAAKGKAEAEAIAAKGLAEAEAIDKKAEAMKKYGQAAMMEMIVKALPEMAAAIAEPLSTIDKVTIIDSGNGGDSGVSNMGAYVPSVLAKTIESVKEATGVDIREIMKASTYDAMVNKNITVSGLENVQSVTLNTGDLDKTVNGSDDAKDAPTT